MLNIPEYRNYSGETKIALMDNSTVAFLEQVERAGISAKELLIGYEVILIPNWVSEEICDSIYRKNFIEDRKSTRLNSSHNVASRMPSSA